MTMAKGILMWVEVALDSHDAFVQVLIDGGMEPKAALQASNILTKDEVSRRVAAELGKRSASFITTSLAQGAASRLN